MRINYSNNLSEKFNYLLKSKKLNELIRFVEDAGLEKFSDKNKVIYYNTKAKVFELVDNYLEGAKFRKLALDNLKNNIFVRKNIIDEDEINYKFDLAKITNNPTDFQIYINGAIQLIKKLLINSQGKEKKYFENFLKLCLQIKIIRLKEYVQYEDDLFEKIIYYEKILKTKNDFIKNGGVDEKVISIEKNRDFLKLLFMFESINLNSFTKEDILQIIDYCKLVLKNSKWIKDKKNIREKLIFLIISYINTDINPTLDKYPYHKNLKNLLLLEDKYAEINKYKLTKRLFSHIISNNALIIDKYRNFKTTIPYLKDTINLIKTALLKINVDTEYLINIFAKTNTIKFNKNKLLYKINKGEGQFQEFKRGIVEESLAREITAFANTNDGCIILGVDDNCNIIGLKENTPKYKDFILHKIKEITCNKIKPSILPEVNFYDINNKLIVEIIIKYNPNIKYFYKDKIYLRHLESKRKTLDQIN